MSSRPKTRRSVGPLTTVLPRVPTSVADTTRGETPRCVTLIALNRPRTSPRSRACAWAAVRRNGPQRWRGETSRRGRRRSCSHGLGAEPRNEFSTFSVRPPEVEKKYVTAGLPGVGHDLVAGRRDGGVGRRRLGAHAAVHLRAHVGVLVEGRARLGRRDGVGARGHGLRLQRLGRPGRRALARDDAAHVVLEPERVDGHQAAAGAADLEAAAVAAAAAAGRCRRPARAERQRAARRSRACGAPA